MSRDPVYWHGKPENPQPPPEKPGSGWLLLAAAAALGALAILVAVL